MAKKLKDKVANKVADKFANKVAKITQKAHEAADKIHSQGLPMPTGVENLPVIHAILSRHDAHHKRIAALTVKDFAHLVGESFTLSDPGNHHEGSLTLTLKEAAETHPKYHKQYRKIGVRIPFSLIFHGPHDLPWEQGNYTLSHASFAPATLLAVPLGPSADGQSMCYQISFS